MNKTLLAAVALAGFTVSASAADLGYKKPSPVPVMAKYNWTGLYVGIQGGYGFSDGIRHDQTAPAPASSGSFKLKGGLVGGTIGYNYQLANNIVLGAEGDYAWSGVKGSTFVGCAAGCSTNIRSFGTARVRVGYAIDRFMPYITGGLALGDVRGSAGGNLTGSEFRAGWTLGAGLEAAVWNNVTAKVEYLYADLGKFNYAPPATGFVIKTPAKAHIIRAGLNYRF
ncbi:MAG: porin family protein [Proteobacteria bacterium]|nr:porin family protein [Pseudomonadota bacterium]